MATEESPPAAEAGKPRPRPAPDESEDVKRSRELVEGLRQNLVLADKLLSDAKRKERV